MKDTRILTERQAVFISALAEKAGFDSPEQALHGVSSSSGPLQRAVRAGRRLEQLTVREGSRLIEALLEAEGGE